MANRRPRRHSSTQGIASDDGDGSTSEVNLLSLRTSQDLNNNRRSSMLINNLDIDIDQGSSINTNNNSIGDDESMFVNSKTETGSNSHSHSHSNDFPPVILPSTRSKKFNLRGLSKSAVQLLSQDDQTLNEMLDMNVNVDADIDAEASNTRDAKDANLILNQSQKIDSGAHVSRGNGNNAHAHAHKRDVDAITAALRRIEELETKLQEKEKEISRNKIAWEQKVQRQQQAFDALEKKLHLVKGKRKHNTDSAKHDTSSPTPIHIDGIDKQLAKDITIATLSPDQIARYSRQLLVTEGWGVSGQQKLLSSRVLVIGAGGIGSTLLLYLASSGVGHITVVDFDQVEMSNLHRQVIHTNEGAGVGLNKAISACDSMKRLNPTIHCTPITEMLTFDNALELVKNHDCVVDASDNPQTRYLINDACILSNTPLVSGSAMGVEGQLTVYSYKDSACYRCLYPKINPTEGSKSCSDNGVLGPVPGLIGVLEAIETLKVLTGAGDTMHDRLLMYDSLRCSFLSIKKGKKRSNCAVCGPQASITSMEHSKAVSSSARGPQQCGMMSVTPEIKMNKSCLEYYQLLKDNTDHVLLDVRVQRQYELCALKGAVNIELGSLKEKINIGQIEALSNSGIKPIYCLCRRGIASAEAARILSEILPSQYSVYNIKGGLNAWVNDIDPSFPMY